MRKVVVAMIVLLCIAAIFCGCSREFCEVSYISEGKEFFKTRVEKGGALRLPDDVPTKKADGENEYEFKGWSDKENGEVLDMSEIKTQSDVVYYAVYEAIPIEQTPSGNEGGEEVSDDQGDPSEDGQTSDPETGADEGEQTSDPGTGADEGEQTSDPEIGADEGDEVAPEKEIYEVLFRDGVSGEVISEIVAEEGSRVEPPSPPEHEGYEFVGWSNPINAILQDTEITALYKVKEYTLKTNVLGEQNEYKTAYNEEIVLEDPQVPQGLIFLCWRDGDGIEIEDGMRMPARDIEAEAVFGIDWTGAKIEADTEGATYKDEIVVVLPQTEGAEFSCVWQDGCSGERYVLSRAGDTEISVTITGRYAGGVVEESKTLSLTLQVAQAEVHVSIEADKAEVLYGDALPEAAIVTDDIAADELRFLQIYVTAGGKRVEADGLPMGEYAYEVEDTSGNFRVVCDKFGFAVKKRPLAAELSAKDIVYGEEVDAEIAFAGFAYGEDESVLCEGEIAVFNEEGDEVKGILPVGEYTLAARGYVAHDYDVQTAYAKFTVQKKELAVTALTDRQDYVYTQIPRFDFSCNGFIAGEDERVLEGEAEYIVSDKEGKVAEELHTGEYGVNISGLSADNYEIKYAGTEFTISPFEAEIGIDAEAQAESEWRSDGFEITPALPDGHKLEGVLALEYTDAGEYAYKGREIGGGFYWQDGFKVTNGADVTRDFAFSYDLRVELELLEFEIVANDFSAVYNGSAIRLGGVSVSNASADANIEYFTLGGEVSKDVPEAISAGRYEIFFRVSAKNYRTFEGSYIAEISKKPNVITLIEPFGVYTYKETVDFAEHLRAEEGEVRLKEGESAVADWEYFTGEISFVVCSSETENYIGTEYTVTVEVRKAKYDESEIPNLTNDVILTQDIVMGTDKTLSDIELAEGFYWTNPDQPYQKSNFANVDWCADIEHYEKTTLKGTVSFTARKQKITISLPDPLNASDDILSTIAASALAYDESGEPFELSKEMFALSAVPAPATGKYTLTIDDEWYKDWKEGSRYYEFVFANGGESATITIV